MRVSVQAQPKDRASWLELARRVEREGFDGLYIGDHPWETAAPVVALAAAAAVTDRIRVGTCVANAGVWEPLDLADEIATLDLVSGGRAVLGVGAGHTPKEWTSTGRPYPSAGERVDRMIELVDAVRALLAGEALSKQGKYFNLVDAVIANSPPTQEPIPLLIGGNGERVLRYGAETADTIGVAGLARTLPDGHRHEVDWSPSGINRIFEIIESAAARTGRGPEVDALVQHVQITDDAEAAATALLPHVAGASVEDLLSAPFVWIGTANEIAGQLEAHRRHRGISRYTVREPAIDDVRQILDIAASG